MTFPHPHSSLPGASDGLPSTGTLRIVHPASATPLLGTVVISVRPAHGPLDGMLALVLELYRGPPDRLELCGELGFDLWEAGHEWEWRGSESVDCGAESTGLVEEEIMVELVQPTNLSTDGVNWARWAIELRVLFHDSRVAKAVRAANRQQLAATQTLLRPAGLFPPTLHNSSSASPPTQAVPAVTPNAHLLDELVQASLINTKARKTVATQWGPLTSEAKHTASLIAAACGSAPPRATLKPTPPPPTEPLGWAAAETGPEVRQKSDLYPISLIEGLRQGVTRPNVARIRAE